MKKIISLSLLLLCLWSAPASSQTTIPPTPGGGSGGGGATPNPTPGIGSLVGNWFRGISDDQVLRALDADDPAKRVRGEIEPLLPPAERVQIYNEFFELLLDQLLVEVTDELRVPGLTPEQRAEIVARRQRRAETGQVTIQILQSDRLSPEQATSLSGDTPYGALEYRIAELEVRAEREALAKARQVVSLTEDLLYEKERLKSLAMLQLELENSIRRTNSDTRRQMLLDRLNQNLEVQRAVKVRIIELEAELRQLSVTPTARGLAAKALAAS